jgi:hypothetical protein
MQTLFLPDEITDSLLDGGGVTFGKCAKTIVKTDGMPSEREV